MAQAVGLVRADPVDGLPAVLRHHVEEVEDDLGVRALGPELLLEGGGHVHDHGVDPGTALGAQHVGEEGPDGLPGAADPDPQDLLAGGVDDDGGVAVALVQGELVDAPHRDVGEVHGLEAGGQGPFVHLLHGMPVDAVEGGPLGHRQHLAEIEDGIGEAPRQALVGVQPVHPLTLRALAVGTPHPTGLDLQLGAGLE